MIRNYLKIAWRNLISNKVYSVINIGGLSLGMACSLLIGLWVQEELSYDRFLPEADATYFVRFNTTYNGEVYTNLTTPGPLQEAINKDISQVAAVTKLTWNRETLLKVGQTVSKEFGRYAAGDFFGVFALPVIAGNPSAALAQPDQIVITRKVAERFFPRGKALGKQLQFNNDKFYTVGAVVENMPTNATVQFDWLVNFKVQQQDWMTKWGNNSFLTYARLKPTATASQAEAAMKNLYARYSELKEARSNYPILQPITSVHLYSEYKNGQLVGGQIEYVRIFSIVAIFILLIACINFMNLATARSAKRAKEVGVRKVVGAQRASLIGQFISESVLTSLLAVGLALLLTWLVLPTFNQVFDKTLTLDLLNPGLAIRVLGLVLVTGLLSGSYPALYLSGLQPIRVLKGALRIGTGPAHFRRVLVVFQFSLSMFLIVGMLAVSRQMDYLRTKSLGLDRGNLLYIPVEGELTTLQKTDAFRQEVMRLPTIASATTTTDLPIDVSWTSGDLTWSGKEPGLPTNVSAMMVGGDFVRTMKIKLLAGRDFRVGSLADSTNYIINEAAAKFMGFKDPIGREIEFNMGKGKIIGLMKDFHLNSLHQAINPLVVSFSKTNSSFLLARTQAG